jgi:hypothetical protein
LGHIEQETIVEPQPLLHFKYAWFLKRILFPLLLSRCA